MPPWLRRTLNAGLLTPLVKKAAAEGETPDSRPTNARDMDVSMWTKGTKINFVHLLEYALGTDPNIFTSGLEWHLVDGGNGEPRFELEFTRPIGLPDISYFIDAAESPGSASKETLSNFTISPIENTDMEKVVVRDDLVAPGAVRRFLWLRIERN